MKGLLINVLILGFLLTLYVYINTDHENTLIRENSAETSELDEETLTDTVSDEDISYRIKEGETLSEIGEKFHVSVEKIKETNGLTDNSISVGEFIDIPAEEKTKLAEAEEDTRINLNDTITVAQSFDDETIDPEAMRQKREEEIQRRRQELIQKRRSTQRPRFTNGNRTVKPSTETESDQEETQSADQEKADEADTEPAVSITDDEIVNLQSEMDVQDLIQTISEITGESFILDESVKGKKITVIAPGGFKKENAMRLFETVLSLNGFSVVKKNGTNIIVPKRDIKITSIPTEFGTQPGEPSDSYITRIVQLDNVQASDVANIMKPLISREGDIVVYPATNTLIIIETVDNLNRILKIIDNLDVETEIEFIKIHNTDAAEVATKLIEIFGDISSAGTTGTQPRRSTQTNQRRSTSRSRNIPGSEQARSEATITSQSTSDSAVGFKVITDERTNSLIVIAYPDDMAKIKAVIEILDVETDEPEEGIYVIRVLNADAEQIVAVLASLFGGSTGGVGSTFNRGQRTGGISTGTTGIGTSTTGGTSSALSRQAIERGASVGSAVVAETDDLRVTADPSTNSIIVIGSKRDYETIKEVIKELDVRRKQVFVEAAILEVSLDKLRSFGTNLSIGFTVNDSTLGFGGTVLPGVPSLLGVAADPEASVNLLGSLSGLFLGVVGEEVDVDGSGPIPPIPSFSALFQALTSLTDVNVLSTPSIITTDNEPAEIIVADVIPFPTGSTVGDSGVTVQTIQREPVGIRLSITPQISEGDFLNLNILTEVSAIRDTPVQGLNTAQFGIATTTRTADSSVVVKNGQTIVIGGLVQDRESVLQNRVPGLGRIPVLGNLFKFKQRQSQKINLMILLTPRIVENEYDMQRILEERQRRNMLLQERGFNREEDN